MVGNTRDRGQTTLDFTIGVSVFLVTLVLVFMFIPGLITPFTSGQVSAPVVADRVADELVQEELAADDEPYTLSEPKVERTLNDTNALPAHFDVPPAMSANVTLHYANGTLAASDGPAPSSDASVSIAWRVVTYAGERAELRVKVW